MWMVKEVEEQ
uniref:Uncharacterized protein n=1 Tax=Rhizophora mucronata TaxID=61149 RepID=A0A2P2QJQ6_RHIMU